ncbi:GvpL/GvpF family gas vesicle protein [Streptomyces blattellae]|uniref:GvpL/GvpF family gas vesicle protein n=1 Tax=Streptomyces blattellae TaxID=2569855 RepID=UPI0012B80855|nr:GvpL/GvpF family gas vesicle protein [Streptomyces blattellae]
MPPAAEAVDARLSYAYAVLRPVASPPADASVAAAAADALTGVHGVADAAVRLVHHGSVAAAVSSVPRTDFSEAALKAHLEDLDWLETVARAHHLVVETLGTHTTVLPLRLATVYLDDDRVRDMLREGEQNFTTLLDRLAGHVEWGVKVYAESSPSPASSPTTTDELAPGRAYLRQRGQQRHAREDARSSAVEAVRRIEEQTRDLAVERARHRPQQGRLAGGTGENIANDAYLVPSRHADAFRERALHAADGLPGVRVEVTGPWVPYSFTARPESEAPAPEEVRQR